MNITEKMFFLSSRLMMLSLNREHNQKEIDQVSEELAALQRQMQETAAQSAVEEREDDSGFLKFTKQEIFKMPKSFRREFRTQGCTAHVRRRLSGRNTFSYEIRYRRNGYNISVSATDLARAKEKFIAKINEIEKYGKADVPTVPTSFDKFSIYYLENFKKRKVCADWYRILLGHYKNHLSPHFGSMTLRQVTPHQCQQLLDHLALIKDKTKEDVRGLLNQIFQAAVKHNIIQHNPLDMVFHKKHVRNHGKALTREEEKILLESVRGTPYELMFAAILYTGLRPCEFASSRIEGQIIYARNRKQKNGAIDYKRIPITPMLKPYMDGVTTIKFYSPKTLREKFKSIIKGHRLYDLRVTFSSRCIECHVDQAAIDEYMGHKLDEVDEAYTDLSDEYLIAEGQKIKY